MTECKCNYVLDFSLINYFSPYKIVLFHLLFILFQNNDLFIYLVSLMVYGCNFH